jgi:hypothetical protein
MTSAKRYDPHQPQGGTVTAVLPNRPDVIEASDEDLRRALRRAERRSGFTYEQLAEQASTGHFENVRARLAWVAIGNLRPSTD